MELLTSFTVDEAVEAFLFNGITYILESDKAVEALAVEAFTSDGTTYILESDEAVEAFAFDGMWMSNYGRLRNQWMLNEYRLDVGRTEQVP